MNNDNQVDNDGINNEDYDIATTMQQKTPTPITNEGKNITNNS